MPPLIVKQLRGRPKKMRRREGWEGVVSSGKKARLSFSGRKMHCGLCRKEGHKRDKCPDKHLYPEGPKKHKGTPQKEQSAMEEVTQEMHLQQEEILTGEDELMNDTMENMEEPQPGPNQRMKFMPTPSLGNHISTGCTPPASTPPTVAQSAKKKTPRKSVKSFAPPRPKKK
ncbi:uncharacterized protein LOC141706434 [Apium graveolens]